MLTRLTIQDVVLIDKLSLHLAAGLNVFTGETGAGKSIVLDSLGLALGGRSEAGLIREGAQQASVSAEFSLPLPSALQKLFSDQGLCVEEALILRRLIAKDGKSRAFVNDQPISIGLLKQIGEVLLEIHGQFETHGLLNATTHRGMLDAFGGHAKLCVETATAYADWRQAAEAYQKAQTARDQARAEEEFLRASVAELEEIAPEADEPDKLAARRTQLQHYEKIVEALQTASQNLSGERGATNGLTQAGKTLARVADKAEKLPDILANIDRLASEADEINQQISGLLYDIEAEPDALQRIEERLFALRAIARKHSVPVENLPELLQTLSSRLSLLTDQGDQLKTLAKNVTTTKKSYEEKAQKLSTKRHAAAQDLAKRVTKELPPLKFERAQFIVDVVALPEEQWGENGVDRVAFLAATNPGSPAGALQRVASGGELSRFMLALKVVLAASDPVPVLVFDEVDAGIGGATASAVGERLGQLAQDVQILVVTHSPQVAARGNHHLRVSKRVRGKQALTEAEALDQTARVEEIARMLAGAQVTEAARKAALSLLDDAAPAKPAKRAVRK